MDTMQAFAMGEMNRGKEMMVFDWEKAARLIIEHRPSVAQAGLQSDWGYTGGVIYQEGEPFMEGGAYLGSTWATPELDLDGDIVPCYRMQSETPGWSTGTCWPDEALAIINSQPLAQSDDDAKLQESIDWLKSANKATVSRAITDGVMVQLYYAAQGDITQFRIKGRKIIEDAASVLNFDSPDGA